MQYHGVILAAASEPFKAMLSGGYAETAERRIVLPHHSHRALKRMVEFLYSGEIEICDDMIVELFALADEFQVLELRRVCEEHVASGISVKSVVGLLSAAKNHTADQLFEKCVEFFKNNEAEVLQLDSFVTLPEDILIELLKMDFRSQEYKVFQAIVRWGEYKVKQSAVKVTLKEALANVIQYVYDFWN
jgi:hypothetical protein